MEEDVGLVIPILGKVEGFQQAIASVKESAAGAMANVREAVRAVGLMVANYLKGAVTAAANGEKNFADLQQTIKSTGGAAGYSAEQIKKMASDIGGATTFSAGQVMKGQNMLLTFTNIQGKVFEDATKSMLDLSQKMGTAPEQTAIQLGKALNDPIKGVTALTEVGVTFTAQQKEQIKAMEATGNMAGAQRIILNELNKEFGGQATAAAQTYDGQMKQLSNTMGSIKATVGSALLPYLLQIAKTLNEGARNVAAFVKENKNLVAGVLAVTAVLGTLIGGASLLQTIIGILGPAVTGIGSLIGGLNLPILAVIAAIALLTTAYVKNFGGFKDFINSTIGNIISIIKKAVAFVKEVFLSIQLGFQEGKNGITDYGDKWVNFGGAISVVVGKIVAFVKERLPQIKAIFKQVFDSIATIWNTILRPVLSILMKIIGDVIKFVAANWPTIQKVISAVFNAVVAIWNTILYPTLQFIIQTIGQIIGWIQANLPLIEQTVGKVINFVAGIIKWFIDLTVPIWQGGFILMKNVVMTIFNVVKDVISTALNVIENVISMIMNIVNGNWSAAWDNFIGIAKSLLGGVGKIIWDILSGIGNLFADIAKSAFNWGTNMIKGFIDGIKHMASSAADAAGNVIKGVKDFLGFNSPSKKGEGRHIVEWGANMIKGFKDGIKSQIPSMQDMLQTAIPNLGANINVGTSLGNISNANSNVLKRAPVYMLVTVENNIDSKPLTKALTTKVTKQIGREQNLRRV